MENKAYNERETCFDLFTELFKKYQSISTGDLNGSKTAEFWAELQYQAFQVEISFFRIIPQTTIFKCTFIF